MNPNNLLKNMKSKTMPEGFKNTKIGIIPKEWEVVRLIDVADYINGYAFSPKDWKDKGLPIIRIQNLNDLKAEFNYFDGKIDEKYIVKNGDLLFSWSASIGVYMWNRGKAVLNQHIFKVVPKKNVDKLYLYYVLHLAIEQLRNRVHGSTMKHFKQNELKTTFIPLPPLEEQKAIAKVLSTVDEAIQKVDLIIEKTERLKKGLMQKLLTKGIGHKEFKDTEIGRIPKEWEVVRLEDIIEIHDNKRIPLSEMERSNRKGVYPYCGANGIIDYIDDYIFDGEFVLLAEDGGNYNRFGKSAYIMRGKFWVNNHAHILRAIKGKTTNLFLLYVLNFLDLNPYVVGSTRKKLNQDKMKIIKIPLPPLEEQQKIAEILSMVDKKLELERKRKEKLEKIKKGLMNDLLTGRKRVDVKEALKIC